MKKAYAKPEITIIDLVREGNEVVTASAVGQDGMSVSLGWLLVDS